MRYTTGMAAAVVAAALVACSDDNGNGPSGGLGGDLQ